jgi:hypothetical protein
MMSYLPLACFPRDPPEGMEEAVDPTLLDYHSYFPWSAGTKATCTAQGIFIQLGTTGSVFFTGFISIQFVLSVRYNWSEGNMRLFEKVCYAIGFLFPIVSASYLAATNQFNANSAGFCWINQYPMFCSSEFPVYEEDPALETWCSNYPGLISEEQSNQSQLRYCVPWVALVFLMVVISMILLFLTVREQEQRILRWSTNAQEGKYQKKVIQKAMLYIGSYLFMYGPQFSTLANASPTVTAFLANVFLPLQGVLNALVYSNVAEKILCCDCRKYNEAPAPPKQDGRRGYDDAGNMTRTSRSASNFCEEPEV